MTTFMNQNNITLPTELRASEREKQPSSIQIRRLFGPTFVLQDWDTTTGSVVQSEDHHNHIHHNDDDTGDNNEANSTNSYWELFIDLLLVAAASSMAETFKESHSISQFVLSYMIIINGWSLYSLNLSTRLGNSSFLASLLLFLYLVGFGWSTANIRDFTTTGPNAVSHTRDTAAVHEFIRGAIMLRMSIVIMVVGIAVSLPRARYFCTIMGSFVAVSLLGFGTAYWGAWYDNSTPPINLLFIGLWIAALTEFLAEMISSFFIDMKKFIPINIEQTQERFDALGLVMLGETVVSITQTFRELVLVTPDTTTSTTTAADDDNEHAVALSTADLGTSSYLVHTRYYWVLTLSLLLVFMMTLYIFHTSPPPEEHAMRRSRRHGVTLLLVQKVIGLPLLAVGVSVKLIVEAVMKEEELSLFGYQCMSFGVGTTLLLNYAIRILHHGGKEYLRFGTQNHDLATNPTLRGIAMIWWYFIGLCNVIPFIWYYLGVTTQDPMTTTLYHAGLMFVMNLVESTISHVILDILPAPSTRRMAGETNIGEQQPLL